MIASLAIVLSLVTVASANVLYVDDDAPGGDGSSWVTAHRFLREAMLVAGQSGSTITEIRVAGGVYTPDLTEANPNPPGANRAATFGLIAGVTVRGGYAGYGAANPDERAPAQYETILSGDLLGDDDGTSSSRSDNSYHVLFAYGLGAPAVVEGVTITGGTANGTSANGEGGGMVGGQSDVTLVDCVLVDNTARFGAGAWLGDGSYQFIDCLFLDNAATQRGGGIYRTGTNNTLDILGCTFEGNSASGSGGGIDFFNTKLGFFLESSIFRGNSAPLGGGINNLSNGMTVVNCLFEGNVASNKAGGLGIARDLTVPDPGPYIVNCTIVANGAGIGGGIATTASNADPLVSNSILWANADAGGSDESAQYDFSNLSINPELRHSTIEGLVPGGVFDGGRNYSNIGLDPLFEDEVGGDYHLTVGSPCIDVGNNASVPAGTGTDLDGNDRFVDGTRMGAAIVDMGAYEFFADDSDGDGLYDEVELQIGTDPFDPDTDGDGLLDGTEVDIADNLGCPDPLDPDSDGDTLADGVEVDLTTDPCSGDTDGDGVGDATDPLPVEPGVTPEFYAQIMLDAAEAVDTVDLVLFVGGNDNQREGRRNNLASNLRKAAKAMKNADYDKAIDKLQKNIERIDGDPHPKHDYMIDSPERDQLLADHLLFIELALLSAG